MRENPLARTFAFEAFIIFDWTAPHGADHAFIALAQGRAWKIFLIDGSSSSSALVS
jgi:hypothetical protein